MKPFIKTNWRSFAQKATVLSLTTLFIFGCGSDSKNEADSDTSSDYTNNSTIFSSVGNNGQTIGTMWSQLKSQYQCDSSVGSRMSDMTFVLQGNGQASQIGGQLSSGTASGSPLESYTGVNHGTKDLIIASKMSSGQWSIIISLCQWNSTGNNYNYSYGNTSSTQFIGPNAGLSQFSLEYLTLSNTVNCATGSILDGWLYFSSQTYGGVIPTRFAPTNIQCN